MGVSSKGLDPKRPPNTRATDSLHAMTAMTAIRIIEGKPTVSGTGSEQNKISLPLEFGSTVYIRDRVDVTPAVDILFITSQPLSLSDLSK